VRSFLPYCFDSKNDRYTNATFKERPFPNTCNCTPPSWQIKKSLFAHPFSQWCKNASRHFMFICMLLVPNHKRASATCQILVVSISFSPLSKRAAAGLRTNRIDLVCGTSPKRVSRRCERAPLASLCGSLIWVKGQTALVSESRKTART
jgi:hypothetical protein